MLDVWQHGDTGRVSQVSDAVADSADAGDDAGTRAALGAFRARVIVTPSATALYSTTHDAACIAGARCRVVDSGYGHCADGTGREPPSMQVILAAMRALLADRA